MQSDDNPVWFIIVARFHRATPGAAGFFGWNELPQLENVITLDGQLSPEFRFDYSDEDWNNFAGRGEHLPSFTTSAYALSRLPDDDELHVVGYSLRPMKPMDSLRFEGFEFAGYDIIDGVGGISLLSNCGGGFATAFAPTEINANGLLDSHARAVAVCAALHANYPEEWHAQHAFVVAMWRQSRRARTNG